MSDFYFRTVKAFNLFGSKLIIIIIFSLAGCGSPDNAENIPNLQFNVNHDSTAIQLEDLPQFVLRDLRSDSLTTQFWHKIFAVYEEGQELEPLPGEYRLDSARVAFFPKGGFREGKTYLLECYIRNKPYNARQMATGHSQLFKPEVYRKTFDF